MGKKNNKMKLEKKDIVFRVVIFAFLTIALVGLLFPVYWMITTGMKDPSATYKVPPDFSVKVKDKYELVIDSTGNDYNYEQFQKDSIVVIWMIYDSQTNKNIGCIKVSWAHDGIITAFTEYSEVNFKRTRSEVISATKLSPLLLQMNMDGCISEMSKKNAFKNGLKKSIPHFTSSRYESEFQKYINELQISDRYGENQRDYFSFDNPILGVRKTKYGKGIFDNYSFAYSYFEKEGVAFFRFLKNSFTISSLAVLFQWLLTAMAAFAVAKILPNKLANFFTMFYVATLMIPSIVYIIPLYSLVSKYNLTDNAFSVVLPGVSNATAFVLFKGFFTGVPKEMYEAAKIDGANEGQILLKIYMPVSLSVFGVIALLTFIGNWNDIMWPSMVLRTIKHQTFPLIINRMLSAVSSGATDYSMALSMSVMAMLPTLLVFMVFQKQLAKGLVFDGIKG